MIDYDRMIQTITNGLEGELTTPARRCKVVFANQTGPIPDYPYTSFTITTASSENAGTWGQEADGSYTKPVRMVLSFTVQTDTMMESYMLASALKNWFEMTGAVYLNDNGITVERVEDITNRDNLITTGYEYRYGVDVVLCTMDTITVGTEYIEIVETKEV